jgi:hypothetical protein
MNFPVTFFISAGDLFDFDLTFLIEGILFIFFSLIITFVFLFPISKQLNERVKLINFILRKSSILLMFGYQKLSTSIEFLTQEISELNRQLKLIQFYTDSNFETQIFFIQKENNKFLSKLKGNISIKSAYLLSAINKDLIELTQKFFVRKFYVISENL